MTDPLGIVPKTEKKRLKDYPDSSIIKYRNIKNAATLSKS